MISRSFAVRALVPLAACAVVLASSLPAEAAAPSAPAPIVFFDIAGPADAKLGSFYAEVFGWTSGPGGTVAVPVSAPRLPGALRTDPAQKIIYIGTPDVTAALAQVTAHGGKVVAPRFEVKGVAVIGLFTDPAGNAMGLVELTPSGAVKIP